jgi:hypothetical protein
MQICGLAMSPKSGEDRMIWNYNKKGDFIVRSAYHLAKCGNFMTKIINYKNITRNRTNPVG